MNYKIQTIIWLYYHSGLIITIITELFVYLLLVRAKFPRILTAAVLVNISTQPLLNYLYHHYDISLLVLEVSVVLIESVMIKFALKQLYWQGFVVSICANTVSYLAGSKEIQTSHLAEALQYRPQQPNY